MMQSQNEGARIGFKSDLFKDKCKEDWQLHEAMLLMHNKIDLMDGGCLGLGCKGLGRLIFSIYWKKTLWLGFPLEGGFALAACLYLVFSLLLFGINFDDKKR